MYTFFIQAGHVLGVYCRQINYIDPKELTPSNDKYLPLDTASYPRKRETSDVIKFYSHQLMHFFIQLCISLLSYIKIT